MSYLNFCRRSRFAVKSRTRLISYIFSILTAIKMVYNLKGNERNRKIEKVTKIQLSLDGNMLDKKPIASSAG